MQLALSSFLAWFDGSQALERIIKLERRRHFSGEVVGGVVTTLLYMIKRVQYLQIDILSFLIVLKESGRQKMIAASLSKEKFATVCFPVIFPPSESHITNPLSAREGENLLPSSDGRDTRRMLTTQPRS